MKKNLSTQIDSGDKHLNLLCVALHDDALPTWLEDEVIKVFVELGAYIKNDEQVLYMRDIAFLAIKEKYAGGHCYSEYEAMIAVPSWQTNRQEVVAALNHELHHMARWQNAGYGDTLGGALVSEGIATYYEELISGWSSPWAKAAFDQKVLTAAQVGWNDNSYNHGEWFFEGPLGEWVGYGIGYNLAKLLFKDGFDLEKSVKITADKVKDLLTELS